MDTEAKLRKGQVVGGADNFNQQYWITRVDASKPPLINANRAVGGLSILPREVDLKGINRGLDSIPRPKVLKKKKHVNTIIDRANKALSFARDPGTNPAHWKFFDSAEVTTLGVYTVPLKMPAQDFKERGLKEHHTGVKFFRPAFAVNEDPAQIAGSYAIFMRLYDEMRLQYESGHYLPWKFDVNIYNFFLKVRALSF